MGDGWGYSWRYAWMGTNAVLRGEVDVGYGLWVWDTTVQCVRVMN
jgi:hypothetical protein